MRWPAAGAPSRPPGAAPVRPPGAGPGRLAGISPEVLDAVGAGLPVPVAPGRHRLAGDEACLMELAAALAREPWGDHPAGVHPVLAAVARAVNDRVGDGTRAHLATLVPRMVGTADAGPDGRPRPERCARLVLVCTRAALETTPFMAAEMNSARLTALSVLERRAHREGTASRRAAASLLGRWGLLGRTYPRHAAAQAAQAVSVIAGAAGEARLAALLRDCVSLCDANVQEPGRDASLG